ncbi:MAG: FAD-binding oxidoreductase, partial [Dolichospermum sp.]
MSLTEEILTQLPGDILGGLRRADAILTSLRDYNSSIPNVVQENHENLEFLQFDVIICGGNLGILIGCALAVRGVRVALLERGILRGREQEWNISRQELKVFRELELLTEM